MSTTPCIAMTESIPVSDPLTPLTWKQAAVVAAITLVTSIIWYEVGRWDRRVTQELGPMEWIQLAFLLLAAGGFAIKLRQRPPLEERLVWWGMLVLVLFVAAREFEMKEVCRLPIALQAEKGLRVVLMIASLWALIRAIPHWPALLRRLPQFLPSRCCIAFTTACFLYIVASQVDRMHSAEPVRRQFIEELLEYHATFLFLLASR